MTQNKTNIRKIQDDFEKDMQEYYRLFVHGSVVIFKWRNQIDWPVEYVSPNVEDVTGYSPETFLKQEINFASIIHKAEVDLVTSELLYSCSRNINSFAHSPYRIQKKDGSWIWISEYRSALKDENGKITHFVGYIIDITEWKNVGCRGQHAVEREGEDDSYGEENGSGEEQGYKTLAEYISDGIVVVQNDLVVYVNYALASIFGYFIPGQVKGKRVSSLFCYDLWGLLQDDATIRSHKIGEKRSFRGCCINIQGNEIQVEARADSIHWQSNEAILVTVKDITTNVNNQAELETQAEILRRENIRLKSTIKDRYRLGNIIGKSKKMQEVYQQILRAAESDASVVLFGESGSGKELAAKAVHDLSDRSQKPFITVNCGAVPEQIIESEFFGYKKGAFTGAYNDKPGYLDKADGGSLFLDEIENISHSLQVKLLRVIDGHGYFPVGGNEIQYSDIRIVSATNKDLFELVSQGKLREDFFYRINVIPVTLPSLRERPEDIPLLIDHILGSYGEKKTLPAFTPGMERKMLDYHWPGNIRELGNVISKYLTLGKFDLPEQSLESVDQEFQTALPEKMRSLKSIMADYEKEVIINALEENHWHKGRVAALLCIDRKTLFNKMQAYKLSRRKPRLEKIK